MEQCAICLSLPPCVTFFPCEHRHLCAACAVRLQTSRCPICRKQVEHAVFEGSKPCTKDMRRLQMARESHDLKEYSETAQVLVLGPSDAAQLGEAFVERICKLFNERAKRGLLRNAYDINGGEEMTGDELDGLPYESPFRANAIVDGRAVRFSWSTFAQNEMMARECVTYIQAAKPDFMLLAASLQLRTSFAQMLTWDRTLRRVMGSALPQRMWVFLAPPKIGRFASRSTKSMAPPNLEFYDDVANALNSIPELSRPLTYHVVEPGSFMTGRLKRVAQRSVFHAVKRLVRHGCEEWT